MSRLYNDYIFMRQSKGRTSGKPIPRTHLPLKLQFTGRDVQQRGYNCNKRTASLDRYGVLATRHPSNMHYCHLAERMDVEMCQEFAWERRHNELCSLLWEVATSDGCNASQSPFDRVRLCHRDDEFTTGLYVEAHCNRSALLVEPSQCGTLRLIT